MHQADQRKDVKYLKVIDLVQLGTEHTEGKQFAKEDIPEFVVHQQ
jgi:hypothetical protein